MIFKYKNDEYGTLRTDCIILILNGVYIQVPNDTANKDWRMFQEWLSLGNTPLSAD